MIGKLKGFLEGVTHPNPIMVDVGGVCYNVFVSLKTLDSLPPIESPITLFIEHIIREDASILCGFLKEDEQKCFRSLMGVQGVGMRVALGILSILTPYEFSEAIYSQDRSILTKAEGVGAKVASRIILELKGKEFQFNNIEGATHKDFINEAMTGLINLGYIRLEANRIIKKCLEENPSLSTTEDLIRMSLQKLSRS